MLAVAAQACVEEPKLVYQVARETPTRTIWRALSSSLDSTNEGIIWRRRPVVKFLNQIAGHIEPRPVLKLDLRKNLDSRRSIRWQRKPRRLLDRARPRWGGGRFVEVIDRVKTSVDRLEELTNETVEAFDMFRPFTIENAYVFRSDNVRSLFERIKVEERSLLTWHPEKARWLRLLA